MFQVNAATIDSRVKGFDHFLNILRTDDRPSQVSPQRRYERIFETFFAIVRVLNSELESHMSASVSRRCASSAISPGWLITDNST